MGLSVRLFLLDQNDGLYRMAITKFDQMLRDPGSYRIPRLAGARARMAEMVVELLDRRPIRVVWSAFGMLAFSEDGILDLSSFDHQQRARAELALAPLSAKSLGSTTVVAAAPCFVAQGGRWTPSKSLARRLGDAAWSRWNTHDCSPVVTVNYLGGPCRNPLDKR